MFLIWGRKLVHTELGSFNDFCPVCRERTGFRAMEFGTQSHLYFVPIGGKEGASQVAECSHCLCRQLVTDVRMLIRERPDDMRRRIEPRVEREKKAALGTLSAEERVALIREPFDVLEHEYYLNEQLSSGDAVSRLGCGGAIVAVIGYVALIPVVMGVRGVLQDVVGWTLLLALLAVIILSIYLVRTRSARYARRKLEPLAADR